MIHFLWRFFLTLLTPFILVPLIFGATISAIVAMKVSPDWHRVIFLIAWYVVCVVATAFVVKRLCDFAATDW